MDFKDFLEDEDRYDAVFIMMNRLGKKSIFVPCYKTCTAQKLAQIYIVHIYCHHETPESIISDCGPQFISDF
jgi:hypothetical protein